MKPPSRRGTRAAVRRQRQRGISTVEVVIWTPVLTIMIAIVFTIGYLAFEHGSVQNAIDDAVRAGSEQHSQVAAEQTAESVFEVDLSGVCKADSYSFHFADTDFRPGGIFEIQASCTVEGGPFNGLGFGNDTYQVSAAAAINQYARATASEAP